MIHNKRYTLEGSRSQLSQNAGFWPQNSKDFPPPPGSVMVESGIIKLARTMDLAAGHQDARREERKRCIAIIQAEIDRVRGLLNVCDISGKPVFDEGQTKAGIAALEHAIQLMGDTDGR